MNEEDFESLRRGLAEARAYAGGMRDGYVVHEPVDVRAVRARTRLTRRGFAERYRLDPRAVEQWEQGRRRPERGTEMYLRLIGLDPDGVAVMVAAAGAAAEAERRARVAEERAACRAGGTRPRRQAWSKPSRRQLKAGEAEARDGKDAAAFAS